MWLALAALGLAAHGLAATYSGLFVLGFAYLGLTQPPDTGLRLIPVAVPAYIASFGGWSGPLLARLPIAVAIWLVLAELLAELVSSQRVMTAELHRVANTDALTGLANRRHLDVQLGTAAPGDAIMICDLDHFKELNDRQGHQAGDVVLAEFGAVLRACLRQRDYAARYGGDEFALVLTDTTPAQAAETLARLRERWAVVAPTVSFSSGVACCRPGQSVTQTLAAADRALYDAKFSGRARDHHERGRLLVASARVPAESS